MGVIAKGILRGYQGLFTPVSLGYPLSVFNKNSTLKESRKKERTKRKVGKRRRKMREKGGGRKQKERGMGMGLGG